MQAKRFIALNTQDKLTMLRQAWADCAAEADLLLGALNARLESASSLLDEDISSSSSNSHTATSNQPGENSITDAESVRAWSQIIEGFRVTRQFLQDCADYGYDAFTIKCSQQFPSPLPTVVTPAITVDGSGRWRRLARFNDVDPALVVGTPVDDNAVFCWLCDNPQLLNIEHGVTESRGDYSGGIIGRSGGVSYA